MSTVTELQNLYGNYLDEMEQLSAEVGLFEDIFGFGKRPGKDSRNQRFYEQVEQLVSALADSGPDEEEAEAVVRLLLRGEQQAKTTSENAASWMFIAIQGHALKLIPFLSPEAARELLSWYQKTYRSFQRTPDQKKVIHALKQRI